MFQFNRLRSIRCSSSSNVVSLLCRSSKASSIAPAQQQRCIRFSNATTSVSRRMLPQQPRKHRNTAKKCNFSSSSSSSTTTSSPSWLEGDIGALGTKIYHTLNLGLAVILPIYFLTPDRYANGYINKTIGFLMATGISLHSYIGLNYVCRDYVPKLSSKLLGPARIVTAGFSLTMLIGMSKIALYSPNGIKGIVTGLWTSSKKEAVVEETTN
jgi:succinate dehydrogenase hydrophobic anchor subunit